MEDAADFDAALQMLAETKVTVPALITLVGTENRQRVVIERTPTRHALRWADGDAPLIATNDYRLLFPPRASDDSEMFRTTCLRYDYLTRWFAGHDGRRDVTDTELLEALTDANVLQDSTAQQIVMRPRTGEVRLFVPRRLIASEPRERTQRPSRVLVRN